MDEELKRLSKANPARPGRQQIQVMVFIKERKGETAGCRGNIYSFVSTASAPGEIAVLFEKLEMKYMATTQLCWQETCEHQATKMQCLYDQDRAYFGGPVCDECYKKKRLNRISMKLF